MRQDPSPVWTRPAVISAAVLVLVGCSSSSDGNKTTSNGFAKAQGCSTLTAADVAQVTRTKPSKRDLAPPPDAKVRCSSAFFEGGTELVVSITERDGDTRTLKRLRAAEVSANGAGSVRPASDLGEGAFISEKRVAGFQRAGTVVTLETGYSGRRLILTVAELERLARLVAQRL
jgi:hypothetical protein